MKKLKFGEPCLVAQAKADAAESGDSNEEEMACPAQVGHTDPEQWFTGRIKAQSAARFENEDNDKYTDKKPTTALKNLPFTYKETLELTCDKQHPQQHPPMENLFPGRLKRKKEAVLPWKVPNACFRHEFSPKEIMMVCNHCSWLDDDVRKKGLCSVCYGDYAPCTGLQCCALKTTKSSAATNRLRS